MESVLNRFKINQHSDNWYFSWLVAIIMVRGPIEGTLDFLGESMHGGYALYFRLFAWSVFALYIIIPAISRMKITSDMILLFMFLFVSWTYSFINNMEFAGIYFREAMLMFITAFPFYCFSKHITDYDEFKDIMYKGAYIVALLMCLRVGKSLMTGTLFQEGLDYDPNGANMTAPACVACLIAFCDRRRIMDLFMFFTTFGVILLYGARVPIAAILIAVIMLMVDSAVRKLYDGQIRITAGKLEIATLIVLLMLLTVTMMPDQTATSAVTDTPGGRLIRMIQDGSFIMDSARSVIWRSAVGYIMQHPFNGTGIINDRLILTRAPLVKAHYGSRIDDISEWTGVYAHNIFLEILMQYGVLFGIIIIIIISFAVIMLYADNNSSKRKMAVLFISQTFGKLLFSGPAFRTSWFWAMLGLASTSLVISFQLSYRKKVEVQKNEE